MSGKITLVLGGARSGKSRFAENLVLSQADSDNFAPVYVATGEVRDDEMRDRIAHHQNNRDARWQTLEEPLALGQVLSREARPDRILLVDCLTLWLSNQLGQDADIPAAFDELGNVLKNAAGPIVLVSNEVGLGIVPVNDLARRFRDDAGRLNQLVAGIASDVFFVAAGLTLPLKTNNVPLGPEIN